MAAPADGHDEPGEAPDGLDDSAAKPPKKSRLGLKIALVVVSTLAVLGVLGAVWVKAFLPDLIRAEAIRRAQVLGIDLEFARFEARGVLPWDAGPEVVELEDVRATLRAAPGARVRATRAVVELSGHEPVRVTLDGLVVSADRLDALAALMKAGQAEPLSRVPFEAEDARVSISMLAEAAPIPVEVGAARIAVENGELVLDGLQAAPAIPFFAIEPLPITLERRETASVVRSRSLPGVTIELDDAATHATFTLDAMNPQALSKLLHADLPKMTLVGVVEVDLRKRLAPEATFDLRLVGFVPPHPPELGGIVFGKETRATGAVRLVGKTLEITAITLKAGSLSLKGSGEADPLGTGKLSLTLKGSIGCAELAASAVGAHFGWEGSLLTGRLARGRLTGTVGVTIEVRSRIDDLEHATASPSAVIRCGVKLP